MRKLARKSVPILFPAGLHPVPKALADGVRKVSGYGHLFDSSFWILDCEHNQHQRGVSRSHTEGRNRKERWFEIASSPEERPSGLTDPAVAASQTLPCARQPCSALTYVLLLAIKGRSS